MAFYNSSFDLSKPLKHCTPVFNVALQCQIYCFCFCGVADFAGNSTEKFDSKFTSTTSVSVTAMPCPHSKSSTNSSALKVCSPEVCTANGFSFSRHCDHPRMTKRFSQTPAVLSSSIVVSGQPGTQDSAQLARRPDAQGAARCLLVLVTEAPKIVCSLQKAFSSAIVSCRAIGFFTSSASSIRST